MNARRVAGVLFLCQMFIDLDDFESNLSTDYQ